MSSPSKNMERLVQAALALCDADQRNAFLNAACAGDLQLRAVIEQRIQGNDAGDNDSGSGSQPMENLQTLSLPPVAEVPGAAIGRYRLLEQIGQGGMGV